MSAPVSAKTTWAVYPPMPGGQIRSRKLRKGRITTSIRSVAWARARVPDLSGPSWSWLHLIGAGEATRSMDDPFETGGIAQWFTDKVEGPLLLCRGGGGFAVQCGGMPGEVGDQNFKNLVDQVGVGFFDDGLLEDQLRIRQQREQLAQRKKKVDVTLLFRCRFGGGQQ